MEIPRRTYAYTFCWHMLQLSDSHDNIHQNATSIFIAKKIGFRDVVDMLQSSLVMYPTSDIARSKVATKERIKAMVALGLLSKICRGEASSDPSSTDKAGNKIPTLRSMPFTKVSLSTLSSTLLQGLCDMSHCLIVSHLKGY